MSDLFTPEERENLKTVLTEGLFIPEGLDIPALTIKIWEGIARLPHSISSTFNLIGNSSILTIFNESKQDIIKVHVKPTKLEFELSMPEYKYTRSDRVTIAFGVMATMNAWTHSQLV